MLSLNFWHSRENEQKTLNKQLLQINTKLALHQYAGSLEDGEPCPLCGSEHHPSVLHSDHAISGEIQALEKQIIALDDSGEKYQTAPISY
jgi:exonuclease SbcC